MSGYGYTRYMMAEHGLLWIQPQSLYLERVGMHILGIHPLNKSKLGR